MIELTSRNKNHVSRLFPVEHREKVKKLLEEKCGETVPMASPGTTPEDFEVIRRAALKVSGGHLDKLRKAIALAHADWRDLVAAAQSPSRRKGSK